MRSVCPGRPPGSRVQVSVNGGCQGHVLWVQTASREPGAERRAQGSLGVVCPPLVLWRRSGGSTQDRLQFSRVTRLWLETLQGFRPDKASHLFSEGLRLRTRTSPSSECCRSCYTVQLAGDGLALGGGLIVGPILKSTKSSCFPHLETLVLREAKYHV